MGPDGMGNQHVAPRAGAWIEIHFVIGSLEDAIQSLPVRERGLK